MKNLGEIGWIWQRWRMEQLRRAMMVADEEIEKWGGCVDGRFGSGREMDRWVIVTWKLLREGRRGRERYIIYFIVVVLIIKHLIC